MSYGFTPKQAAAYDHWKTTPPDEDSCDECPECNALLAPDGNGYKCTECSWSVYPDEGPEHNPAEDCDVP
jgi:hypothetical protein